MRGLSKLLVGLAICVLLPRVSTAQTIKSISIAFATTDDDKDWNSQVRDRIVCNNLNQATLNCCSADRNGDHWDNNSTHSAPMSLVVNNIQKGALNGCTIYFGMAPVGHDTWIFIPTLTVTYTDGSQNQQTFAKLTLASRGEYVEQSYTLSGL